MLKEVSKALFEEQTRGLNTKLAKSRGWTIHKVEFPIIDCEFSEDGWQGLRILMECSEWDERPPSIELQSPDGNTLPEGMVPVGSTHVFNKSRHQNTQRPFVCMRGSYEYHTHSSHINDLWSPLRGKDAYTLGEILSQLWNAWKKDRKKC